MNHTDAGIRRGGVSKSVAICGQILYLKNKAKRFGP